MMSRRWRRGAATRDAGDINITAFLNLMVILVPFLLITAVFSRVAILELTLPAGTDAADPPQELRLEVTIRRDALEIGERNERRAQAPAAQRGRPRHQGAVADPDRHQAALPETS
jgi:biopolymer transport protein ExbD